MKKTEAAKRYLLLCIGLCIMSFGIACSIKGNLGTSPISSLPYVLSLATPLSVGTVTILMHLVFISLQILILRKQYEPIQLLQLPVALVFGVMTDFAVWVLRDVSYATYSQQWLLSLIAIVLMGIGVSCEVTARVVTLAGEGLILAIAKVTPIPFSSMKILFDASLAILAVICSVVFLHGLYGVREGTLAAALLVGIVTKWLSPFMNWLEQQWILQSRTGKGQLHTTQR